LRRAEGEIEAEERLRREEENVERARETIWLEMAEGEEVGRKALAGSLKDHTAKLKDRVGMT
jgi:hypothetical protein